MKKKALAIAAAALMLTIGASVTSYASGWSSENGTWVYLENSGDRVRDTWKKGADGKWRYLDSNGYMATDCWVDDYYYVDSEGIMVSGKWLQLDRSSFGSTEDNNWYYFGDSGKCIVDAWKKINDKWYHFSDEGAVEYGWVDDNMYYTGEDGAALIGWHKLEPSDDEDNTSNLDGDGRQWYYFNSSGKKFVPDLDDGAEYGEKRIDGYYYCFDEYGAMQTGWVYLGTSIGEAGDISDFRFYDESSGKAVTGWYSAEPPEDLSGYDDSVEWFYFNRNGEPKYGPEEGEATTKDFLRVNNKTYLFNQLGNPVSGLQKVHNSSNYDDYTAYYFDEVTRAVCKGKMNIAEGDGTLWQYYFQDSGRGYTGVEGGYLYYMGKLQKSEDSKYDVISIPSGDNYINYLINASGKVVKSTSGVKDSEGNKYVTNSSGIVNKINDDVISSSMEITPPAEPRWN